MLPGLDNPGNQIMGKILLTTLIVMLVTTGCANLSVVDEASQTPSQNAAGSNEASFTETSGAPAHPARTTPRLRINNQSAYLLHDLVVIFPDDRLNFGDVAAGATTDYVSAPDGVYRYAAYQVEIEGQVYAQPVIDWVGQSPLEGEAFTYLIDVDSAKWETNGQVIQLMHVIQDQVSARLLPADFSLEDLAVQAIIKGYLVDNLGLASYGGKVFCAYQPLTDPVKDSDGSQIHLYLWALCQEYYLDGQNLQEGTGWSVPVAILLRKAVDGYDFDRYMVPGDGSYFSRDVKDLFPPSTWNKIMPGSNPWDIDAYSTRAENLSDENRDEAEKAFLITT